MIGRNDTHLCAIVILAAMAIGGVAGCGSSKAKDSVNEVLKQSGKSRSDVIPLSGKLTIDGQPAEGGALGQPRIMVLLFDQAKLDAPPRNVLKALCNGKGEFAFSTYDEGDGVPPGKYVLTFVKLKFDKKKGYVGKDGFKNLYNDPVQNSKVPDLVVDLQPPGKKDYGFDLKIEGRDAATPGPKAVTTIRK
jgi:hypothetical protein